MNGVIDQIPPHNLEAEMALLGSVLVDREIMRTVGEIVKPTDFYAHVHETIYTAVLDLFDRGEPLDKITISEALRQRDALERVGGLAYLNSLMDTVQTAASAAYYAKIVREKAVLRSLIHAGSQIVAMGRDGERDVGEAVRAAQAVLESAIRIECDTGVEWDISYPVPVLSADARQGFIGQVVSELEPVTEAHPAALVFTTLVFTGCMFGNGIRAEAGGDPHPPRFYPILVGATNSGKGQSLAALKPILRAADPEFFRNNVRRGFASGEAIIADFAWADDTRAASDRRLVIVEPEFSRLLTAANRDGSTLSPILRDMWDSDEVALRKSQERKTATGVSAAMIGHIVDDEFRLKLSRSDEANGFGNRLLPCHTHRTKKLPSGGGLDESTVNRLAAQLSRILANNEPRILRRDDAAEKLWEELYHAEPDRDGIVGTLTARAHAQRLRLSVAYAALDGATRIRREHLLAADACWRYSVQTVEYVFGSMRSDPIQRRLLETLRRAYPQGMEAAQIDRELGRTPPGRVKTAREELERRGLVRTERVSPGSSGGRPRIVSYAVPKGARP